MTRTLLAALACAACVALVPPAHATTVPPLTAAELVAKSALVARVVVRGHRAAWVGRRILTFYDVDVVEAWRFTGTGPAPRRAVIALPGGVVGDIGQRVFGAPVLEDGQAYVACLGDALAPSPTGGEAGRAIIGLWRGLWRVDGTAAVGFTEAGPDLAAPLGLDELRGRLGGTR